MERQEETAESDWLSLLLLLLQPCIRSDNDFFLAIKENMGQENLYTLKECYVCKKIEPRKRINKFFIKRLFGLRALRGRTKIT